MCVALTQAQPELLETGFIDGDDMPLWLQPYVGAALKCGYLSGIPTENGLAMEASDPIRQGEAAVMLAKVLNLPKTRIRPYWRRRIHSPPGLHPPLHRCRMQGLRIFRIPLHRLPAEMPLCCSTAHGMWQKIRRAVCFPGLKNKQHRTGAVLRCTSPDSIYAAFLCEKCQPSKWALHFPRPGPILSPNE